MELGLSVNHDYERGGTYANAPEPFHHLESNAHLGYGTGGGSSPSLCPRPLLCGCAACGACCRLHWHVSIAVVCVCVCVLSMC